MFNSLKYRFIDAWRHFTSDFESAYHQGLIETYRFYQFPGGRFTDPYHMELQQVFVPLRVSLKSSVFNPFPDLSTRLSNQQDIGQIQQDFSQLLTKMASDSAFRQLIVLGKPGSGKTTLLTYIGLAEKV